MSEQKPRDPSLDAPNAGAKADVQADVDAMMRKFDRESNVRIWQGVPKIIVSSIIALFSLYCIYSTLFGKAMEQVTLSSFMGLVIIMGFLTFPARKGHVKVNHLPWYDIVIMIVGAACFFFYAANAEMILKMRLKVYLANPIYTIVAIGGILVLGELCRRSVGLPILCVAGVFLCYTFISGETVQLTGKLLFYSDSGILGTPISVCSKYIVVFIIFGAFLERTGVANFFISLANSLAGRFAGGPAKVAVISSALCGMVSGSSVGNTVTTGSITIPMMKDTGYKPEFAGAVEASASTGGQIMPPIMGAAAFLMAEYTGVPYSNIILRAILPAVLYFLGIFIAVHLEAKKLGLKGIDVEKLPRIKNLIKDTYMLLPLIVLIYLVCSNTRTMQFSAAIAIVVAIAVGIVKNVSSSMSCRKLFRRTGTFPVITTILGGLWAICGAYAMLSGGSAEVVEGASLLSNIPLVNLVGGILTLLISIAIANQNATRYEIVHVSKMVQNGASIEDGYVSTDSLMGKSARAAFGAEDGFSPKSVFDSLEAGGRSCISVAVACGMAGIICGCLTITGLASTMITAIVGLTQSPVLAAVPWLALLIGLLLTMLCCIVLGMGIPTTATYCIMASTCAPILIKMGVPVLAAHFFVFYFGIVADITPPVALAAYAGAAIAKAKPMQTGVTATRLAIGAFIIPFVFASSPAMLLIDTVWYEVILITITSALGMVGVAAGLSGFLILNMNMFERILAVAGGMCLIVPGLLTDFIGLGLIGLSVVLQVFRKDTVSAV